MSFGFGLVSLLLELVAHSGEASADTFAESVVRIFHLLLVRFIGCRTGGLCKGNGSEMTLFVATSSN